MDNPTDKPIINKVFLDGTESEEKFVSPLGAQFVGKVVEYMLEKVAEDDKVCFWASTVSELLEEVECERAVLVVGLKVETGFSV